MTVVARLLDGTETKVEVQTAPQVGVAVESAGQQISTTATATDGQQVAIQLPGSGNLNVVASGSARKTELVIQGIPHLVVGVLPSGAQQALSNALLVLQQGSQIIFENVASVEGIRSEVLGYRDEVLAGQLTVDNLVQMRLSEWGAITQNALEQNLQTYLGSNFYTINGVNTAIAGALSSFGAQFSNDLETLGATLSQDYYTSVQVDEAISSATMTLQSAMEGAAGSVGQIIAALGTDYYTVTQADEAIAQASLDLVSELEVQARRTLVSHFIYDSSAWTSSVSGAPGSIGDVDAALSFLTEGIRRVLVGPLGGFGSPIGVWSKAVLPCIPGNTYRVRALARSEGAATNQLRLAVNLLDDAYGLISQHSSVSGNTALPTGSSYSEVGFEFTVPTGATAVHVRAGGFFDPAAGGLGTPIQIASLEIADITPVARLRATLENDYYTRAGTDTAISSATTVLSSAIGEVVATVETQQEAVATLEGYAEATISFRADVGPGGALLELVATNDPTGPVSTARIVADQILLEGTVTADLIEVGTINADLLNVEWLVAGRLSAEYLDVNSMLTIGEFAGLRYNKTSAGADELDGIFLGRDDTEFGFAASRTAAGRQQSLKITSETGLQLLNARHYVSGETPLNTVAVTANLARTPLPAGTTLVKFSLLGGGAAGACVAANGGSPLYRFGQAGSPTVVRLYDGATLIATYTADGGIETPAVSAFSYQTAGELSPVSGTSTGVGAGGVGGTSSYVRQPIGSNAEPQTITYYARGGDAGYILNTAEIDVTGMTSPEIEIDFGFGGVNTGVPAGYSVGTSGRDGHAFYSYKTAADIPADVVPLIPTHVGSFSKAAGAVGSAVFPDFGPGLWVIHSNDLGLCLGTIQVAPGSSLYFNAAVAATFFASQRPVITTAGSAAARTINYLFYSMSEWG